MIRAFLLLTVPLCPLIDACRGITCTFCIPMPHHWLLPGHHMHILHFYALSLTLAGASHAHFAFLCPLIGFCRGINRTFCISMPHHWLLPGHHMHILHFYALSLAFAGASTAHFASLCPIIDFCRGINRTFCIPMPHHWLLPGYQPHFLHLYAPFVGIFPN